VLGGRLVEMLLVDRDTTVLLGEEDVTLLRVEDGSVVAVFAGEEKELVSIETGEEELCVLAGVVEAVEAVVIITTVVKLVTVVCGERGVLAATEESTGVIPTVVR
jgi:hypothetical protein